MMVRAVSCGGREQCPSKIHISEGRKHFSFSPSFYENFYRSLLRGYTAAMQLVTPRAVAMAVRIEMAV